MTKFADIPSPPPLPGFPTSSDPIFDRALRVVLKHEGQFSNDPADPGGPTMYGISLRFAKGVDPATFDFDIDDDGDVDAHDIRGLDPEYVASAYRVLWWNKYRYADFVLPVSIKLFDMAVNMGAVQAHKLAQRAVRAVTGQVLAEDGVLGPESRRAIATADAQAMTIALRSEAAGFYRSLAAAKPQFKIFEKGWLNRAYA
jgi:lysozyme family protein